MLVTAPISGSLGEQLAAIQREYHVYAECLPPVSVEVMNLEEDDVESLNENLRTMDQFEITFSQIGSTYGSEVYTVTFEMDEESEKKWLNFCSALGCESECQPFIQLGTCYRDQDLHSLQSEISQKSQVFSMHVNQLVLYKQNEHNLWEEQYSFNFPDEIEKTAYYPGRPAALMWGQPGFYEITRTCWTSDKRTRLVKGTFVKVIKVNQKQAQICHPAQAWCDYKSSHLKPSFQLVRESPFRVTTHELASKVTLRTSGGTKVFEPREDLRVEIVCSSSPFLRSDEVDVRFYFDGGRQEYGKLRLFNKEKQFALAPLVERRNMVKVGATKGDWSSLNVGTGTWSDVQSVTSYQSETTCSSSGALSAKPKGFVAGKFYKVKKEVYFVPNMVRNKSVTTLHLERGTKIYLKKGTKYHEPKFEPTPHEYIRHGPDGVITLVDNCSDAFREFIVEVLSIEEYNELWRGRWIVKDCKVVIKKPCCYGTLEGTIPYSASNRSWYDSVITTEHYEGKTQELKQNRKVEFISSFGPNTDKHSIKLHRYSKIFVKKILPNNKWEVVVQKPGYSSMEGTLDGRCFDSVGELKAIELGTKYSNNFGVRSYDEPRLTGWKQWFFKEKSELIFTDLQGHFGKVNRPGKSSVWINLLSTNLKKTKKASTKLKKFVSRKTITLNTENFPALGC